MSFEELQSKVKQAEQALEARERSAAADWRQFGVSWREAWTPGRIVLAGLASGFLAGKARGLQRAGSDGGIKLLLGIGSLLTAKSAEKSADVANQAAQTAGDTAEAARQTVQSAAAATPEASAPALAPMPVAVASAIDAGSTPATPQPTSSGPTAAVRGRRQWPRDSASPEDLRKHGRL